MPLPRTSQGSPLREERISTQKSIPSHSHLNLAAINPKHKVRLPPLGCRTAEPDQRATHWSTDGNSCGHNVPRNSAIEHHNTLYEWTHIRFHVYVRGADLIVIVGGGI